MSFLVSLPSALEPFGAAAVLAGFSAGLMPRRALILGLSALCSVLFCAHFLRIGSATGAAMCLVSAFQSMAALAIVPGRRPGWVGPCFVASSAVAVGLTIATWSGLPSALAGTGALLATAARLQEEAQRMRVLLLACALVWLGHNLAVGSVFGMSCDLLSIGGLAVALRRHARPAGTLSPAT